MSHLNRLRERLGREQGYTFIELLVVVIVIGVLAAIALPAFLGQSEKGQDSGAKANARNMVSQIEACSAVRQGYSGCAALLTGAETNLPVGIAMGQVTITAESQSGYMIEALSMSGGRYAITRAGATSTRTCTPPERGGCRGGRW